MSKKETVKPDYKRIYLDLLAIKYPNKRNDCQHILDKEVLIALDIMVLDKIIFGHKCYNQKYRSYDENTILEILKYQKSHNYNNTQLANYFQISRNTVTRWRKTFHF
ncbi:helix-turn-helix domain-containing protein [Chryseobacterium sp. CKR4-1]|nr:helix-turn-helix domain-containing protein [Chryseobacterium sp. CKR4-1]